MSLIGLELRGFGGTVTVGNTPIASGTSSLAQQIAGAETLLADSAAFRARLGVSSAAEAQRRIFAGEVELPRNSPPDATLASLRPFVLLVEDAHGYVQIGADSQIQLGCTGGVLAIFQDNPRFPDNHKASFYDFAEYLGGVIDDVAQMSGQDDYFPFVAIEQVNFCERVARSHRASDDFWIASYLFRHATQ